MSGLVQTELGLAVRVGGRRLDRELEDPGPVVAMVGPKVKEPEEVWERVNELPAVVRRGLFGGRGWGE